MVTRDAVLTIFEECDRDNDGIVWLSEIKQLALSYASSNEVLTIVYFVEISRSLIGILPTEHQSC